jgi:hypothetical protein
MTVLAVLMESVFGGDEARATPGDGENHRQGVAPAGQVA